MKRTLPLLAAVLAAPLFASPADAGEQVVMVELFTSQGCYSCPPADAMLGELAAREDVVALAMHVDYWDYLGWKDTFAQKAHTLRQIGYRDSFGARSIYTPQMIVQGRADVVGSRKRDVAAAIEAARATAAADIEISNDGRGLIVACSPSGSGSVGGTVWAAVYDRTATVAIARGENAGKTLTYHNIVRDVVSVGEWDGASDKEFALPDAGPGQGVAVWVQDGPAGAISAAVKHEF